MAERWARDAQIAGVRKVRVSPRTALAQGTAESRGGPEALFAQGLRAANGVSFSDASAWTPGGEIVGSDGFTCVEFHNGEEDTTLLVQKSLLEQGSH